ncbi:RHS repeat domain-containing protein [Streptomyces sp. NPDC001435]|uniref:RHS repeat domain-containing protein n=1 Tax=Streptomyces sp. NPDC001435 TaxID=3364576 RepID=UPI00367AB5FD
MVHSGGYRIALDHDHARSRITGLRLIDPAHPDRPGTTLLTFAYDEHGHLSEEFNSSRLPMRYTYDVDGRITSWTDRNGTNYWYEYDDQGRVIATGGTGNALASTLTSHQGSPSAALMAFPTPAASAPVTSPKLIAVDLAKAPRTRRSPGAE